MSDIKNTVISWDNVWTSYDRRKYEYQLTYQERSVRWQHIESIIINKYGSFKNLNCIEIGAGSGHYSMLFVRRGAKVTLLDYSKNALDLSHRIFKDYGIDEKRVSFINMDALQMDNTLFNRYDVSMSFGVAEHFKGEDRFRIVKAHYDVLRKRGITFISVPNAHCLLYRMYKFIRQLRKQEIIECYPYSKKEFRKIADECAIENLCFFGFSYKETFNPLAFYRRKKGFVKDVSRLKREKPSFLDAYLGRGLIFCGIKKD